MRNIVLCFLIWLLSHTLVGQDMIRLQYGDSIPSKITEVGKKEVKYLKQSYLDGPVYSVPNRKVINIKHHNGEVEKLNVDKRVRNYRAGFSFIFTEEVGKLSESENFNNGQHFGLGYEGIIRLKMSKRISFLYNLNLQIGEYSYDAEMNIGTQTRTAYYAIPAVYTGVNYRQPIYKDFGLFSNVQIGYMTAKFFKPELKRFSSPYASYIVALGMYVREFKISLGYNTGVIEVNNDIPQIIPQGDYRLHMIQFVLTFEF